MEMICISSPGALPLEAAIPTHLLTSGSIWTVFIYNDQMGKMKNYLKRKWVKEVQSSQSVLLMHTTTPNFLNHYIRKYIISE